MDCSARAYPLFLCIFIHTQISNDEDASMSDIFDESILKNRHKGVNRYLKPFVNSPASSEEPQLASLSADQLPDIFKQTPGSNKTKTPSEQVTSARVDANTSERNGEADDVSFPLKNRSPENATREKGIEHSNMNTPKSSTPTGQNGPVADEHACEKSTLISERPVLCDTDKNVESVHPNIATSPEQSVSASKNSKLTRSASGGRSDARKKLLLEFDEPSDPSDEFVSNSSDQQMSDDEKVSLLLTHCL